MTERHRWPTVREMMVEMDQGLLDDPTAFKSGFELDEPATEAAGDESTSPQPVNRGRDAGTAEAGPRSG